MIYPKRRASIVQLNRAFSPSRRGEEGGQLGPIDRRVLSLSPPLSLSAPFIRDINSADKFSFAGDTFVRQPTWHDGDFRGKSPESSRKLARDHYAVRSFGPIAQSVAQLMVQTGSGIVLQHLSAPSNSVLLSDFARTAAAFTLQLDTRASLDSTLSPRTIPISNGTAPSKRLRARSETIGPIGPIKNRQRIRLRSPRSLRQLSAANPLPRKHRLARTNERKFAFSKRLIPWQQLRRTGRKGMLESE